MRKSPSLNLDLRLNPTEVYIKTHSFYIIRLDIVNIDFIDKCDVVVLRNRCNQCSNMR